MTLSTILDDVIHNADECDSCNRPRPLWLQKAVRAVYKLETDYEGGLILLTDALYDKDKLLKEAKYVPYKRAH